MAEDAVVQLGGNLTSRKQILDTMSALAEAYPPGKRVLQLSDLERLSFHAQLLYRPGGALLEIGGGHSLVAPTCAALGMQVYLLDDFADSPDDPESLECLNLIRTAGVRVICQDATAARFDLDAASLDVVSSFGSIEHWHASPRLCLQRTVHALKPGGMFVLSVPNAVDVFARWRVLFGKSCWSSFDEWYYPQAFRGHVRELTTGDLRKIAQDLGLEQVRIFGRNWRLRSLAPRITIATRFIDNILRFRPAWCSNIYLCAVNLR